MTDNVFGGTLNLTESCRDLRGDVIVELCDCLYVDAQIYIELVVRCLQLLTQLDVDINTSDSVHSSLSETAREQQSSPTQRQRPLHCVDVTDVPTSSSDIEHELLCLISRLSVTCTM